MMLAGVGSFAPQGGPPHTRRGAEQARPARWTAAPSLLVPLRLLMLKRLKLRRKKKERSNNLKLLQFENLKIEAGDKRTLLNEKGFFIFIKYYIFKLANFQIIK